MTPTLTPLRSPAPSARVADMTKTAAEPTIVVVDDEPLNVELLSRIIERAGLGRCVGFADARSALDSIDGSEPDLVLLDVHLPGMDGFAAMDALQRHLSPDAFVPVVFLTGDVDRDVRTHALAAGAKDFITKPFDIDEVVLRCRNLLETRRLHEELRVHNQALRSEVHERTVALEAAHRDRLAVATALGRPRPVESSEEAATLLCREIADYPDVAGAAIIVFGPANRASPLAVEGSVGETLHVGRWLPAARTAELRERASNGPWVENQPSMPGSSRGNGHPPPARLLAPLHSGRSLVGVLAATTNRELDAGRLATLLPTVVEYAALAGAIVGPDLLARQREVDLRRTIEAIVRHEAFKPVFQPIVDLESGKILGHEALTRFADGERPERRFADAEAIGLGVELEMACLGVALEHARSLPGNGWLSLNVSPEVVLASQELREIVGQADRPVVLEITEHLPINDYAIFRAAVDRIGSDVRFAIDDAGAGFSSFRHIVELKPDFVKLDIGLVRAIDADPVRQALVSGMDYFALKTNCTLIAEGIETNAEKDTLHSLAVELGQGFLLGRPEGVAI
jgi:EAL domain-containing protein (putative c-di-GMP-specific phosphodiesterase class I)/DNA-binding NarL/FixJ family response regulator